jgi:pilus assembly protein CpaE
MLEIPRAPVGPDELSLAIGVMGPDDQRLKAVTNALAEHHSLRVTEFASYPPRLEDLAQKLAQTYDVLMIDVDADHDYALGIVESLCAGGRNYVMAYSEAADMKLAVRFMRAGVREFFTLPIDAAELTAALKLAAAHRAEAPQEDKNGGGKLFVFLGTKGGCGVTTLASNFALALAQESDRETLLIDLGLPLGDAAINLGIVVEYSVSSALQTSERLDAKLLSTLVVRHGSGLAVLGAGSEFPESSPTAEAINKLIAVARQNFEFVVVDVGSRLDLMNSTLFKESSTVFLVTQVGVSELRTANLMMKRFFSPRSDNVQIVINRYKASDLLFDEKTISDALTRPAEWKIPDDYAAARRRRETATPMVMIDSAIAQSIRNMATTAGGLVTEKDEKKGFFRFLR